MSDRGPGLHSGRNLVAIKTLHTPVWAFFVARILAIWVFAAWLAARTKPIFGALYAAGVVFTLASAALS